MIRMLLPLIGFSACDSYVSDSSRKPDREVLAAHDIGFSIGESASAASLILLRGRHETKTVVFDKALLELARTLCSRDGEVPIGDESIDTIYPTGKIQEAVAVTCRSLVVIENGKRRRVFGSSAKQ
jgi:hypothetical protein